MKSAIQKIVDDYNNGDTAFYVGLQKHAQTIAENNCNGIYFDEATYWSKVKDLENELCEYLHIDSLPNYIELQGDPRGAVTKILSEKIADDEKEKCIAAGILMDWGRDFMLGIIKDDNSK